jgi:hypothetical protein
MHGDDYHHVTPLELFSQIDAALQPQEQSDAS